MPTLKHPTVCSPKSKHQVPSAYGPMVMVTLHEAIEPVVGAPVGPVKSSQTYSCHLVAKAEGTPLNAASVVG
jgi:hypothetical protein